MPSIQFKDIIDSHKGKTAFVLGLGPSLKRHIEMIMELRHDKERYVIISCNNIDKQYPELIDGLDFWCLAQPADEGSEFYVLNAYNRYNKNPNTVFMYTDCLDLSPRDQVDKLLKVRYIQYDQRHWNNEKCSWLTRKGEQPTCCSRIVPGRKAIQEEFRDYTGGEMYGAADTVGVHLCSLATLIGCSKIMVTGIDLDYSSGYANNDFPENKFRTMMGMDSINKSPELVLRILKDLTIIRDCAEKTGTKIYCLDNDLKTSSIFQHLNIENAKA